MAKRSTGKVKPKRAARPAREASGSAAGARGASAARARKARTEEGTTQQILRVFRIVRRMRGRRYVYPRLTLEGGALTVLGLQAGDLVTVDCDKSGIRIRPQRRRGR